MDKIEDLNICICTRSMNIDLYQKSMSTIQLPFKKKRYCFTTADGYLYDLLKLDYDYVINIDEDAFVIDNDALLDLVVYCLENKYVNCGIPDGGVSPMRGGNPIVTNPFFNIFDIKQIRSKFDYKEIKKQSIDPQYYWDILPHNIIRYEYSLKEHDPFYRYFTWLAINFKTLYLDADVHSDGCSTVLKNHQNKPFIVHTWYSRMYGKDEFHTKRIDNILLECTGTTYKPNKLYLYKVLDLIGNKFYYPLIRKTKRFLVLCHLRTYA